MPEWILIFWATIGGIDNGSVSDLIVVGTYSSEANCREAKEELVLEKHGDGSGGVMVVCVPVEEGRGHEPS